LSGEIKMAGHGGRRPGAGRKPRAERFAAKIASAEKKIADRLPEVIDSLFELAEGVTVQETDQNGRERVYTRAPDFRAASYLVDRILGKPVNQVEADVTSGGEKVGVVFYIPDNGRDGDQGDPAAAGAAGDVPQ
jgi:hypothetical protein